jgi:hypothetical protein
VALPHRRSRPGHRRTRPGLRPTAEHGGVLHVACGHRRETVCPACSAVYQRASPARHSQRFLPEHKHAKVDGGMEQNDQPAPDLPELQRNLTLTLIEAAAAYKTVDKVLGGCSARCLRGHQARRPGGHREDARIES